MIEQLARTFPTSPCPCCQKVTRSTFGIGVVHQLQRVANLPLMLKPRLDPFRILTRQTRVNTELLSDERSHLAGNFVRRWREHPKEPDRAQLNSKSQPIRSTPPTTNQLEIDPVQHEEASQISRCRRPNETTMRSNLILRQEPNWHLPNVPLVRDPPNSQRFA